MGAACWMGYHARDNQGRVQVYPDDADRYAYARQCRTSGNELHRQLAQV